MGNKNSHNAVAASSSSSAGNKPSGNGQDVAEHIRVPPKLRVKLEKLSIDSQERSKAIRCKRDQAVPPEKPLVLQYVGEHVWALVIHYLPMHAAARLSTTCAAFYALVTRLRQVGSAFASWKGSIAREHTVIITPSMDDKGIAKAFLQCANPVRSLLWGSHLSPLPLLCGDFGCIQGYAMQVVDVQSSRLCDEAFVLLLQRMPSLVSLDVSNTRIVNADAVQQAWRDYKPLKLRELVCRALPTDVVKAMLEGGCGCPLLGMLDVGSCDVGPLIEVLCQYELRLTSLSMKDCRSFTMEDLAAICASCSDLQFLNVRGMPQREWKPEGWFDVAAPHLHKLSHLRELGSPASPSKASESLFLMLPFLRIIQTPLSCIQRDEYSRRYF